MSGGAGSAGTAGPGNGQGTPAAASAGSTGSGPGSASAASSGNGQGTTAAVSGVSTGSQAGQGHSAPLGDPSRKSAGAEEELRIPAAAKKGPTMETQKQPEPSTVDEAGAKRAAAAAVPVPQVEVRAEDIERLPPERRAALMRYLRQIQSRRAATAPTEGK